MTIVVGGPVSGGGLTMPQAVMNGGELKLKSATNIIDVSNVVAFYTSIERDNTAHLWDSATYLPVANTTEQTIIDITGQEGVLTNVKGTPASVNSATQTIRVTIDGVTTTFSAVLVSGGNDILILGDLLHLNPFTNTSTAVTYGNLSDNGWDDNPQAGIMLNPVQVVQRGLHGMVFKNALKVTIQGSSPLQVGTTAKKATVSYTTYIPEGL